MECTSVDCGKKLEEIPFNTYTGRCGSTILLMSEKQ